MDIKFNENNFDLIRLFAACEVLLLHSYFHLGLTYPSYFRIMSAFPGVSMFFVMSGFLISASYERNPGIKEYFTNRALRIFPGLWVCLIVTVIVISAVTGISFINKQAFPWFISQCLGLIYTPEFLDNFGFGSYNGSLWTIPLELQFYILLPILYFILSKLCQSEKQKTWILLFVFFFFFITTTIIKLHFDKDNFDLGKTPKLLRYTFIPHVYLFLLGVAFQRFKIYRYNLINGKGVVWLILYLLVSYLVPTSNMSFAFKLCMLGVTTISVAYTAPLLSRKLLKGTDISYGMYIYHGLVLGIIVHKGLLKNANYVLVIFIITTLLALASWYWIEKPFIQRKRKTIHLIPDTTLSKF